MLTGIDHVVIAVRSVEAASESMERDLGLAVTGGGRHEGMGTHNRLAFLGDTYLELIGVDDAALVRASKALAIGNAALDLLVAGREGLATYALTSDSIEDDVERLRTSGSTIGPPVPGSRLRPDGELIRWVVALPPLGPGRPPFLIEHEAAGAEWGAEARAARARFRHPVGGEVRVAALELPVADADATAREYGTVLGIAFSEGWRATIGDQQLVLREGAPAPLVELAAEPGSAPLDLVRFGIRWRRT